MSTNIFKFLILPLILVLAALAVGFWVLMPLYGYANAALEVKKQNEENLAERKKLTANLERLISQYNERGADVASFNKAIPAGQNIPELLINLEALASETGMVFSGVNFKSKDFKGENIKTLIMEIKVKGSYFGFQNYLKAMEKSLRIFDVVGISFVGVGPGQIGARTDNLEFNLIISTYYQ
ncbi:MAG: type 4a pilus biogenesis protein PilO [Candidatus Azambacteria bacterium]|nr:type 4a pilus biogenesis protein PilO [Candidatus Azambacteria bacterium]